MQEVLSSLENAFEEEEQDSNFSGDTAFLRHHRHAAEQVCEPYGGPLNCQSYGALMQSLVLAGLFAWMEGLFAAGYRPKLHEELKRRVEENCICWHHCGLPSSVSCSNLLEPPCNRKGAQHGSKNMQKPEVVLYG